jgi:hypothetical protein
MNKAVNLISKSLSLSAHDAVTVGTVNSLFPSVLPDAHILDVLRVASTNELSVIPVVDELNNYLGSIESADLIDYLADLLGVMHEGGIIVLQVSARDYSIQQIARIIEENNAKVLSLSAMAVSEGNLEIHIKIDHPDLNPILRSLERFNYTVLSKFQASEFDEELKGRYDELMRYLNM